MKVTKSSTIHGEAAVNEQQPDPVNANSDPGSSDAAPAESERASASGHIESPKLAPGDTDAGATDTKASRPAGEVTIMAPYRGDPPRSESGSGDKGSGLFGKRRLTAMAAVLALAALSGAAGGALMMAGLGHYGSLFGGNSEHAALQARATDDAIARFDADLTALKKATAQASTRLDDRLDRIEKAEAEPAAKLARLSEMVEKLHAAPMPVPGPVASVPTKEATTGSIQPPPAAPAKPEIARLPTVEGWVLRDVDRNSAIIEGRRGLYEVFAGDDIPGLGRIDAIRRQDGRWVVVTSRGLVVAR
jgi:hypothetical protein